MYVCMCMRVCVNVEYFHIYIYFSICIFFTYMAMNERVKCFGFMQFLQATLQLFSYYLNNQYLCILCLQLRL